MKLLNTKISGLKLVKSKLYFDKRGFFKEVFKKKFLKIKIFLLMLCPSQKKMCYGVYIYRQPNPKQRLLLLLMVK